MNRPVYIAMLVWTAVLLAAMSLSCAGAVKPGAAVLLERHRDLLAGKRVGLICNQTSRLPDGTHLADALVAAGVDISALFAPEHGIRGVAEAGERVLSDTDRATGLPVRSLYGASHKPKPGDLRDIDLLLFDLQDAGARFYTYASTMALVMEAAGEAGIDVVILDRPNPINGVDVEGPLLDTAYRSFVGMFPIPVRHGLTLGELARMIAGEGWISSRVNVRVIAMEGWKRGMYYDETGLPWIAPSPNLRTVTSAVVYPGTCLMEGTSVSEGRGTPSPFEMIGAPWLDGVALSTKLVSENLPGVRFSPTIFTPVSTGSAVPKYSGRQCGGIRFTVADRQTFRPVLTAGVVLSVLQEMYPDSFKITSSVFDRLCGGSEIREKLASRKELRKLIEPEDGQLRGFETMRTKYLIY